VITVDDLSGRIAGVAGDTDEAGDVDVHREREGVSGVLGGLLHDEVELGEEEEWVPVVTVGSARMQGSDSSSGEGDRVSMNS
jgi:hypothetical protein